MIHPGLKDLNRVRIQDPRNRRRYHFGVQCPSTKGGYDTVITEGGQIIQGKAEHR